MFCPFTRGVIQDKAIIDHYVKALIQEIKYKAQLLDLYNIPINAIFFGGGTPSMLSPDHILELGKVINDTFNLSDIKEYSFEIEVKSLTLEKAQAMKEIGVTHPRFGLQTFSKEWRELFHITAHLDDVYKATNLLKQTFSHVSFDIIYGMWGQSEEQLLDDLEQACDLGTSNIDIYPIDNVVTQPKLHKILKDAGKEPTSARKKLAMKVLIDAYMRSRSYMPHNGHGYRYVGTRNYHDIIYKDYTFKYHEHIYGPYFHDIVGFGVSAISKTLGFSVFNTANRGLYIKAYQNQDFNNQIIKLSN